MLGVAAGDVSEADIVDLGEFRAQLLGELVKILVGVTISGFRLRRQRHDDDRDVVDAAADDQRLGNPDWNAIDVGADFFVHAQDRIIGFGADQEARGDHDAVVLGLAVGMLDAVDALDDGLQRLGDELDRVRRFQAVGTHGDVDHRHADLRLFLARNRQQRDKAGGKRRQQKQRRQRRTDCRLGQPAGQPEVHGRTSLSDAFRPDRISSPSGMSLRGAARPRCTGTSASPLAPRMRT